MTEVSITALGDEPPAVVPSGGTSEVTIGTGGVIIGCPPASHETILLAATTTLPATHPVLTIRATAPSLVDVEDAPDGTVVTVHVAEGWQHITWASGITVTGATDTTETWVVLVRAEGAWQSLVSGEQEAPSPPDSGVVDVNGLVNDTDWYRSWGVVEVRRIGSMVTLSLDLYTRATWTYATNSAILTLPVGYRPSSTVVGLLHKPDSGGTISLRASSDGWVEAQRGSVPISNGGGLAAYLTYMTDDPWPA